MSPSLTTLLHKYESKKKNGLTIEIRRDKDLSEELKTLTNFLDETSSISIRLYCIINNIIEKPLCGCQKQLKFHKINRGFYSTCGDKQCTHNIRSVNTTELCKTENWKASIAKGMETRIKRYGAVSQFSKDSSSNTLYIENMLKTYGTEHALQNKDILAKQQSTIIERFGTLDMLHLDKVVETIKDRYGANHPMKNKEIAKRAGQKQTITKNGNLDEKIAKMNLTVISVDDFYTVKCNVCKKIISNVTRDYINYTFRNSITPCQHCFPENHFRSNGEQDVKQEIEKFYNGEIQVNRKYLGMEVDIIIPDKKIAIEYNGTYWHSELHKNKNYHKDKKIFIEEKGYQLIQIWEDDWNNIDKREIIISRLKNKLGFSKKIYARKCEIKIVEKTIAKQFLEKNHLQGSASSSIRLGLFFDNELVAIVVIGKSINSVGKRKEANELLRYCTNINTNIIGGFSRLVSEYFRLHNEDLYSYADCDWISLDNSAYQKAGFILEKYVKPEYFWVINGLRENNIKFKKHKIAKTSEDLEKTEIEIMHDKKCYRAWNSGNLLFKHKKD